MPFNIPTHCPPPSLTPFATAVLSYIFLNEHPSKKMWLTIIACFFAVLYIFYDSYLKNLS